MTHVPLASGSLSYTSEAQACLSAARVEAQARRAPPVAAPAPADRVGHGRAAAQSSPGTRAARRRRCGEVVGGAGGHPASAHRAARRGRRRGQHSAPGGDRCAPAPAVAQKTTRGLTDYSSLRYAATPAPNARGQVAGETTGRNSPEDTRAARTGYTSAAAGASPSDRLARRAGAAGRAR